MADAKFPIIKAPEELGVVPTTGVRARIDTRTGAGLVGAVIGRGILDLGVKWDLMAAKTQLSKSSIDASNRINEYFIELDGNDDPATYGNSFERLSTDLAALAPRNRKALRVYNENLARQIIQVGGQTRNAAKAKLQENAQEVDFLLLQKAKDSGDAGDFLKYSASVIGNLKLGDVYTATEAERLLDGARNEAELVQKRTEIAIEEALEIQQEADRDKLGKALNDGSIDYTMIDNSSVPEAEQEQWRVRMNTEVERKARGEVIVTNEQVRANLRSRAVNIWRGADTKANVLALLNEARFGESPTIDDAAYKELSTLVETKLEKVQADFLAEAHRDGQEQLVDLGVDEFAFLRGEGKLTDSQIERRKIQLWWADRFDNEMEQWVQDNPDKNKREGYQQAQMVLAAYSNTPHEEIELLRANTLAGLFFPAIKPLTEEELKGGMTDAIAAEKLRIRTEGEVVAADFLAKHPVSTKTIVQMQGPQGGQTSVGVGDIGTMLDKGLKFPPGSNVRVKRNALGSRAHFKGLIIEPGKRVISFDGGKTWQLLP
ncbi:hypothetical protein LCGC14_1160200 [marine sediment metagenome]|uniref:Uncharacterized protein n=1 Tax=marine sediment metagenome TaxID=412755 RepID=A0A0F9LXU5_9ZZZZ